MGNLTADHLAAALAELDAESRALLDLSLRKQVPDADLARLTGSGIDSVIRARDRLLEGLATTAGIREAGADVAARWLRDLTAEQWLILTGGQVAAVPNGDPGSSGRAALPLNGEAAEDEAHREAVPEVVAEPEELVVDEPVVKEPASDEPVSPVGEEPAPDADAAPTRKPWLAAALATGLLGAAAIVAAWFATDDGDGQQPVDGAGSEPADVAATPPADVPAPTPPAPVDVEPLPGIAPGVGGIATLTPADGRTLLRLELDGLPPGTYEAWLYDSVADSQRIGRLSGGTLRAPLPPNADEFGFVDVARDGPGDRHSGGSVARVPLDELRSAGG